MQKWVWGCFALAVFAGAGVYLAADHAVRHPDSFIGRCAVSAVTLTTHFTPVVFNRATRDLPVRGLAEHKSTLPDKPACHEHDAPIACHATPQGFEPIVVEVAPEFPEVDDALLVVSTVSRTTHATPMFMPYAADDCQEIEETGVNGWFGCELNCSDLFSRCWQTLRTMVGLQPTAQDETIERLIEEQEDASVDGVEYPHQAQEDPHYHHHYPCCPYTGRCPQPYHTSYPILPRADETQPQPNKPTPNGAALVPAKVRGGVDTMECKPSDLPYEFDDESPF